jgi:hypothetical protein
MSEKLLKAIYGAPDRPLKIGNLEIPCYVLEDKKRVLVQTGLIKALGMSPGTGSRSIAGGDRLAKFVGGKAIKPFIPNKITEMINNPIKFKMPIGGIAYGYEATILADICDAVLEARKQGFLQKQQLHIAAQSEILMRGFAQVGIIALVDEATGYQVVRDREILQAILDKYIRDEWAKWTKRFPDEFYKEMFRLRNISYPPISMHRPKYVGHWTNDIVYTRLAPGVLKALREKNPRQPSGERKRKHHQYLTEDLGIPELQTHLSNIIFLMKGCTSWDDFKRRLNRASPKYGDTIPLGFDDEYEGE